MDIEWGTLGVSASRYGRTPFAMKDAVGNPIGVGSRCKVFRHYLEDDGDVLGSRYPVGTTFTVITAERLGYEGLMAIRIDGAGWIHHGMILVL